MAGQFEAVIMIQGEEPQFYLNRIDEAIGMLAAMEDFKTDTVNRHIARRLSNDYEMERRTTPRQPTLSRAVIEPILRERYHNLEDETRGARRHALYSGGSARGGPDGGRGGHGGRRGHPSGDALLQKMVIERRRPKLQQQQPELERNQPRAGRWPRGTQQEPREK